MTVDEVRETLPQIPVRIGSIIKWGMLCGRNREYAIIYVPDIKSSFEVSWKTATHCINTERPVII